VSPSFTEINLTGCTFACNFAPADLGGGLWWSGTPSTAFTIKNCIFWENGLDSDAESAQIHPNVVLGSNPVSNSCIQGLSAFAGNGNIGNDPVLHDPQFCNAEGEDGFVGTVDDNLRLSDGSPCIDAGNDAGVPADTVNIDEDTETTILPWDLDKQVRVFDAIAVLANDVDMGAYENHHVATCPRDLDGDGEVGTSDFLALLEAWGPNPGHPADFYCDNDVGTNDFLILLQNWGPCPVNGAGPEGNAPQGGVPGAGEQGMTLEEALLVMTSDDEDYEAWLREASADDAIASALLLAALLGGG
jgi:hypothetical protein